MPSYFGIIWRARTRLDDSLDVLAGHGVGGLTGALLTGVFADATWGGTNGALHGNVGQLGLQALGVLATIAYSGVMSFALLRAIGLLTPLRVSGREEGIGIDVTQHGEEAYTEGEGAVLVLPDVTPTAPAAAPVLARVRSA